MFFRWKLGQWGRCRACKKKGGVRIREVQCIKTNPNPNGDDILVEDIECKGFSFLLKNITY